jgi:hypothetical protein
MYATRLQNTPQEFDNPQKKKAPQGAFVFASVMTASLLWLSRQSDLALKFPLAFPPEIYNHASASVNHAAFLCPAFIAWEK